MRSSALLDQLVEDDLVDSPADSVRERDVVAPRFEGGLELLDARANALRSLCWIRRMRPLIGVFFEQFTRHHARA